MKIHQLNCDRLPWALMAKGIAMFELLVLSSHDGIDASRVFSIGSRYHSARDGCHELPPRSKHDQTMC